MCAWRRTFLMGASPESALQWEGYSRRQGCPHEGNLKEAGCGNRLTTGKSLVRRKEIIYKVFREGKTA